VRTTALVPTGWLASQGSHVRVIAILRDLLLVAVAGLLCAWIGQLLGRHVRVGLAMPLVGSAAAAMPRALILLMVLWRVNRTGVLTAAAVAEVLTRLTVGVPGLLPTGLVVPVLAATVADAVWRGTSGWHESRLRLAVTGAVLAGTRVAAAWLLLALVTLPPGMRMPGTATCCAVLVVNTLLGIGAGIVVARPWRHRSGTR